MAEATRAKDAPEGADLRPVALVVRLRARELAEEVVLRRLAVLALGLERAVLDLGREGAGAEGE